MNNQQHTKHGWLLAAATTICLGSGVAFAAGGSTYKWVDEHGVVHYSDHVPNEALTKGGLVLDKQGRPVQKIEAPLTPEQRNAKEAEDERQRLSRREREDRARRDRALTQSYTTEEDIDIARSRALSTIAAQVRSAEIYTEELVRRREELAKQKLGNGAKAPPAALERELANIDRELLRQSELIVQKREEMAAISARYDADKQRWQQIKVEKENTAAGSPPGTAGSSSARNAAISSSTATK